MSESGKIEGVEVDGRDLHAVEIEITNNAVRGLFLINGGGAIALLALMGQALEYYPEAVPDIAVAAVILATGSVLTATVNFMRSFTSQMLRTRKLRAHKVSKYAQYVGVVCAFLCFLFGVGFVAFHAYARWDLVEPPQSEATQGATKTGFTHSHKHRQQERPARSSLL